MISILDRIPIIDVAVYHALLVYDHPSIVGQVVNHFRLSPSLARFYAVVSELQEQALDERTQMDESLGEELTTMLFMVDINCASSWLQTNTNARRPNVSFAR